MARACGSPLPIPQVPKRNIPRKTLIILRLQVAATAIIIVLVIFLKSFFSQKASSISDSNSSGSQTHSSSPDRWPLIEPRRSLSDIPITPRNLYFLTREDVLYCYIPKNACSRFKRLLRKREGFMDWRDRSRIHGKNGLQRLSWLSRAQALDRLSDDNVKKFVVVRDPFSRLVSAYQNKVATPWPDQRTDFWNKHLRKECPGMINTMTMPKEGSLLSLVEFLKCLLSSDNIEPSNEHWRPQTQLCGLDFIHYDIYLHLETLVEDVSRLMQQLSWRENTTELEMTRNPVFSKDLADYFDEESISLTLQYYAYDFDILKYPRVPSGRIDFYSVFDGTNYQPGLIPLLNYQSPNGSDASKRKAVQVEAKAAVQVASVVAADNDHTGGHVIPEV